MGDQEVTPAEAAPAVAVVVPVKDRIELLAELIDALRKQSFDEFEAVVVDDHSDVPLTPERLGALTEGDQRFRVIANTGTGAVEARIAGVAASRAPILAFTDSDCAPEPSWLERGVAALDKGADVVQGATLPERRLRPGERSVFVDRFDGLFATCNVFFRRDAYERAGGFDSGAAGRLGFRQTAVLRGLGFGEDALLGWRVAHAGRWEFVEDAVVRHHVFAPSLRESVRRAWLAGAFPTLVRDIPELRETFLTNRVFIAGPGRLPLYAAVVLVAARRRGAAAMTLALWCALRAREVAADEPQRRQWPIATAHACTTDAVAATALVVGSVRARTVVL